MRHLIQTLHGYDQGHRLLASSQGAALDERELARLERLSDLSGYLPMGTRFDHYHTGFPCGRYYAFACTWPDLTATRAGTVLTHTLLLPPDEAGRLDDLWRLAPLHRRPRSASDLEPYRLAGFTTEPVPPNRQQPDPDEVLAVMALLFGTPERPLLWVDERQPDAIVRFIWEMLRAEQRAGFSFCTFALQPRTLEGRPFQFLGIPPAARGSFLEQASSETWWDSGKLLNERLASLTQQPWAAEFAREGAPLLRRLEAFCRESGLDLPALKDIPPLWRFMVLEPASHERLAAARSRADLFERLWPGLDPTHPAATPVLLNLLARQSDATLEPRPLWELTDFLSRPLVRGRLSADADFTAQVEQVLVRELARRLEHVPERTVEELPRLLEASGSLWGNSLLTVIERVLRSTPNAAMRLAPPLLLRAVASRWVELLEVTLACMPEAQRQQALEEALQRPGIAREEVLRMMEEVAYRIDDAGLILLVGRLRGHELEALHTLTRRLLDREEGAHLQEWLTTLLARVDEPTRLAWALESGEPPGLSWLAAEKGAEAASELALGPEELVRRCGGTPNGARLLLLFVERTRSVQPFAQALRHTPELALHLLVLALKEEGPRHDSLTKVATDLIPSESLLAPELRRALLDTRARWRIEGMVRRLGPEWIRALCTHDRPLDELAGWLELPPLRKWLRESYRATLLTSTGVPHSDQLLAGLASVLGTWLDATDTFDVDWIAPLLEHVTYNARTRELEGASEQLAHLLRRLPPRLLDERLGNELFTLVYRTPLASGWRLIELLFPPIYARVLREGKSLSATVLSIFTGKDWDKAKPLRQWLVDTYVARDWPPASFLRSLDGDTALFFRLAHRAARSRMGMDFLRRLPSALDAHPELARWRRPVEDFLAHPDRPIDFE